MESDKTVSEPDCPMKEPLRIVNNAEVLFDGVAFAFIVCFLFSYFDYNNLFSSTITAGGDTASHYFTAQYLRDYLLPQGKLSGWCQGNLGGFPILQYYFPLPFLAMAVLSWIMPLQIAFKLVSIAGIFLLPACTYLFFRLLRQPFPIPIIGATLSLAFLLNEGNSMWGGNILSTLAGEFCFGIGFSLSVLWLGLLFDAMTQKKSCLKCGILLALIGLCHGYALLFDGFASLFFLLVPGRFRQNLIKLVQMHTLAILLMGFWLLPLLAFLPYTTRFSILWIFYDLKQAIREIFPLIFLPFILLCSIHAGWTAITFRRPGQPPLTPVSFIGYLIACGAGLYAIGYRLGLVDVRFLPFFQFFLITASALVFSRLRVHSRAVTAMIACIALLASLLWVDSQEKSTRIWSRFNYEGFEKKTNWSVFSATNAFLQGTVQDPRVVYEHSLIHDQAGSVRAFESLPLFSGRSTLECVYIQGSLNSPFIFYIQSEISKIPSTPIPDYNYSRFNLERGIEHLNLYNVRDFIAAEATTHEAAEENSSLNFRARFGPYEVYESTSNRNRYVAPVFHKPVLVSTKDWKMQSYRWFRLSDLSVPIVFKDTVESADQNRFFIPDRFDPEGLPAEPVANTSPVKETIKEEEILIDGAAIGKPLWIKISYHPNWKVEGADRIYLASPAFMLIYPDSSHVRLYYGRTWPDYAGAVLTCLGLIGLILSRFACFRPRMSAIVKWYIRGTRLVITMMIVVLLFLGFFLIFHAPGYPSLPYNKGVTFFSRQDYSNAKKMFKEVMNDYPQSIAVDDAGFMYAMCFYRENDWENTLGALSRLLETYPETRRAAESWYHVGMCNVKIGRLDKAHAYFEKTIRDFPKDIWARYAMDRIKEFHLQ
jgi:hypothetical protein